MYCHPTTKGPFYVGKGSGGRMRAHLTNCKNKKNAQYNTYFYRRLRKLFKEGIKPQIVKVFEGSEQACLQTEMFLIQSYGRICDGGMLCNHTLGGTGTSGRTCSELSKKATSEHRRNAVVSAETRQKLSTASKRHKHSLESRKKMSDAGKGRVTSLETRKKMSQIMKGRPCPPETVLALSRPVEGFNLSTGEIVCQYPSMTAADIDGYDRSSIRKTIHGRFNSHKGLGWRFQLT
jgi:hypothetical protein